jgi:hypothetical protein
VVGTALFVFALRTTIEQRLLLMQDDDPHRYQDGSSTPHLRQLPDSTTAGSGSSCRFILSIRLSNGPTIGRAPQALEEASDTGHRFHGRTLWFSAAMVSDIGDGRRSQWQEVGETTTAAGAGGGSQIRRKRGQIIVHGR